MPGHDHKFPIRMSTTRTLLAHRDSIRRQMQEAEELRQRAFTNVLMRMGRDLGPSLNNVTAKLVQVPELPDSIDWSVVMPDPQQGAAGTDPGTASTLRSRIDAMAPTLAPTSQPADATFVPTPVPPPSAEELAEETELSQKLAGVRPGGRAEAFLQGRRFKTGSVEEQEKFATQGSSTLSPERHRHLQGEVWDDEKQMMVSTFDPEVATKEEKREKRKHNIAQFVVGSGEGLIDTALYSTAGAAKLAGSVFQGMSDADAEKEGALYQGASRLTGAGADFFGDWSDRLYDKSDEMREGMANYGGSVIQPGVQLREKPFARSAGQVTGTLAGEAAKYIGGGALVKAGLRGMGFLGQAQKFVPKVNQHFIARWSDRIGHSLKEVGVDVLAFGPVDAITTQREIDSAAKMVTMLAKPEILERFTEDPVSWFGEQQFDEVMFDNFLPWLNEVAAKAVQTAGGRAMFDMALGGFLDIGIRGLVGASKGVLRTGPGAAAGQTILSAVKRPEVAGGLVGTGIGATLDAESGSERAQNMLFAASVGAGLPAGTTKKLTGQLDIKGIDSGIDPQALKVETTPPAKIQKVTVDDGTGGVTQYEIPGTRIHTEEMRLDRINRAVLGVDDAGEVPLTKKAKKAKSTRTLLNDQAKKQLGLNMGQVKALGVDVNDTEAYATFLRDQVGSGEAPGSLYLRDYDGINNRPEWMSREVADGNDTMWKGMNPRQIRDHLKKIALDAEANSPGVKDWYAAGAKVLAKMVPDEEVDRFVKFLSTFSQNTDPKTNLIEAAMQWHRVGGDVKALRKFAQGRTDPITRVLPGKKAKAKMVLGLLAGLDKTGKRVVFGELDTPKIWSFAENLLRNEDPTTIDIWMWRMLGGKNAPPVNLKTGKRAKDKTAVGDGLMYAQAREELRAIARELTEETGQAWTPAQVQAATWVEYRGKWTEITKGKREGNDTFEELMLDMVGVVTGKLEAERVGIPEVLGNIIPQRTRKEFPELFDGTATTKEISEYAEDHLRLVRPPLLKVIRKLDRHLGGDITKKMESALGTKNPIGTGVVPKDKLPSGKDNPGRSMAEGGGWAPSAPVKLPPGASPAMRRVVASVMGGLTGNDEVLTSTVRLNDNAMLDAVKDIPGKDILDSPQGQGLAGEKGGVQLVTKEFLNARDGESLARHLDEAISGPLADALKGVQFRQMGDALLFVDDVGDLTPQQMWDQLQDALNSWEGGRFFDDIADIEDMRYTRTDAELITGGTDGEGWGRIFDEALAEEGADQISGLDSGWLKRNIDNTRAKSDELNSKYRERIQQRVSDEAALQDTRASETTVDTEGLKGPPDAEGGPGGITVAARPEVTGTILGTAYGLHDPDDPISPLGGAAIGLGLTAGGTRLLGKIKESEQPLVQRVVKKLGGAKKEEPPVVTVSDDKAVAAIKAIIETPDAGARVHSTASPTPEVPPTPEEISSYFKDVSPEDFVNKARFGIESTDTEKLLDERILWVAEKTGIDPDAKFTWKQTRALAESMGLDPDDVVTGLREQKGAMGESGARLLTAADMITGSTKEMTRLYKKMSDGGIQWGSKEAEPIMRQIEVLDGRVNQLLANYMPALSEAGRVLNSAKILAQDTFDPAVWLTRAQRMVGGDHALPPDVKALLLKLAADEDKAGLIKLLGLLNESGIAEQVATMGKAFMLSGIPTHMMNLTSTAMHVGFEELKDIPAALIDRALVASGIATERTKSWGSVRARLEAARLGAQDGYHQAKEVLKGNPMIGQAEKWDQAKYHINITLAQQTPLLKDVPKLPEWIDAGLQGFQKTVFGSLGAGDAALSGFALRRSLAEQARVLAINAGHKGADIEKQAAKILSGDIPISMMTEAIAQAELSTFRTRGRILSLVPEGKRILSKMSKEKSRPMGQRVLAGVGLVGIEKTMPFVQTPMNVAGRVAEASPVSGAYRLTEIGVMAAGNIAHHLGLKKKNVIYKKGAQKQTAEALGRATTGGAVVGIGMVMYNNGTLSLGYTPEEQGQRQLTGEKENTWLFGDQYISMERLSPIGNLILLGGYTARAWQNNRDPDIMNPFAFEEKTVLENLIGVGSGGVEHFGESVLMESAEGVARTLIEQTFLQGIRDLFSGVMRTEREGVKTPFGTEDIASVAVANIMRRLDRYMDPVSRVREGPGDYLRQWKPGASKDLMPRRDPFGKPIRYVAEDASPAQRFYQTMIDPLATAPDLTTNTDGSPNLRGLLRELDVQIAKRRREEFETVEQYDSRQVKEGTELEIKLLQFIGSPRFGTLANGLGQNEHFKDLVESGHLNERNSHRLMPALLKAIQAEAISQEISKIRSEQSAERNARIHGGRSMRELEKFQHQQRLRGPSR